MKAVGKLCKIKLIVLSCLIILVMTLSSMSALASSYRYIPLPEYYSSVEKTIYDRLFDSKSMLPLEMYDSLLSITGYDSKWESRGVETWIDRRVLDDYKDYYKWYTVGTYKVNNKLGNLVKIVKGSPYSYELMNVFAYPKEHMFWDELFGVKRLEWDKHDKHNELNRAGELTDIDFIEYRGDMGSSGNVVSKHMSDDWEVDVITLAPRMLEELGYSLAGMRLNGSNVLWGYYQFDKAVNYGVSVDEVHVLVIDIITGVVVRNEYVIVLSEEHYDWFPQYWELDIGYTLVPYGNYVAYVSFGHKINFVNKTSNSFYSSLGVSVY